MRAATIMAAAVVLAAAGCGGSTPRLARTDAAPLIALADRIAHESPCAQKRDLAAVRARTIALVNRKAVPSGLQEPLLAGVNDLASRSPACALPQPSSPPPAEPQPSHDHGHGHGHDNGQGQGGDEGGD
jgi:hypothetical protein